MRLVLFLLGLCFVLAIACCSEEPVYSSCFGGCACYRTAADCAASSGCHVEQVTTPDRGEHFNCAMTIWDAGPD
jgi:hypothetical protein